MRLVCLLAVQPGADIEVEFRLREFQLFEEDSVHLVGVVLAGMEGEVGDVPGFALSYDGRELDNFRPGAGDEGEHA